MYSVSGWQKARGNKVKEKSARFSVAQIKIYDATENKKTRFRFFTFPAKDEKLR